MSLKNIYHLIKNNDVKSILSDIRNIKNNEDLLYLWKIINLYDITDKPVKSLLKYAIEINAYTVIEAILNDREDISLSDILNLIKTVNKMHIIFNIQSSISHITVDELSNISELYKLYRMERFYLFRNMGYTPFYAMMINNLLF